MKEFVIGVLSDPRVIGAVAGMLMSCVVTFTTWLKTKVTFKGLVNEWWQYIQPIRDAAIEQAQKFVESQAWSSEAQRSIVAQAVTALNDVYVKNEDGKPSSLLLSAVQKEIENAIAKVVDGVATK